MTLYEFRLFDDAGKVSAIQKRECKTVEEAISLGRDLVVRHRWVEIWLGGQPLARLPSGEFRNLHRGGQRRSGGLARGLDARPPVREDLVDVVGPTVP